RSYALRGFGDLREGHAPPGASMRRPPKPRRRMTGERVKPGAHAAATFEPTQSLPEILACLGEDVAGVVRVANQGHQKAEDFGAIALDGLGGGAAQIAIVEQRPDAMLQLHPARMLPNKRGAKVDLSALASHARDESSRPSTEERFLRLVYAMLDQR